MSLWTRLFGSTWLPSRTAPAPRQRQAVAISALESSPVADRVIAARRAAAAGHIDQARSLYQQAAYDKAQLSPQENDALKAEVSALVMHDPLYLDGLALIRDVLNSSPGMLQADLGKAAGENREALNYVLYYAAERGEVVRVKAGRSYKLYLPGQQIPPETKRPRTAG